MLSRLPAAALLVLASAWITAPPAAAQEAPAAAGSAWEFPKELKLGGQRMSLHEPTVLTYDDATGATTLRAPLAITDGVGRVSWSAIEMSGMSHVDLSSRLVLFDGGAVAGSLLSAVPEADRERLGTALSEGAPKELVLRLELFTDRPGAAPEAAKTAKQNMLPPAIHVRRSPAILIQVDGEPAMRQVADFPIEYVTNSATDLFRHTSQGDWYMLVNGFWATSKKLEGPWAWLEGKLPIVMTQLKIDHPRGHVRRWIPSTKRYRKNFGDAERVAPALPEIIVATRPAELIQLHGDPLFTLVPGAKLMVVANTESDVLFHPKLGKYFLSLAGRWFTADEVDGKWAETYGSLPPEFARIPRDHARSHLLWCVPGTPEANEAAARAILKTRGTLHERVRAQVRFAEKSPKSAPLNDTKVRIVTNSEDDCFQIGDAYYTCVRGAWFRTEDPRSSFKPVAELPETLHAIPESTSCHHVNACDALGAGEKVVTFAVDSSYDGVYVHKGAPVYGTAWHKRGTLRNKNWYPRARTYGENRWYDPVAGVFQPRSVRYDEAGVPMASLWSPYTASYGRIRWFADRYRQGGRRMIPYDRVDDDFNLASPRFDVYATWGNDLKARNGADPARFPLGDRAKDTSAEEPAIVADAEGRAHRLVNGAIERHASEKWATVTDADDDVKARLAAHERTRLRASQLSTWMTKRRAPLPINPEVTPRAE